MKPASLILSGMVRRWHMNPAMAQTGETNAHHQWMVAALITALFPDASSNLMFEALFHDVGELVAGDLSASFKDENPDFAQAHAWIELQARRAIVGQRDLTAAEALQLKLADRLAAYLWMLMTCPHLSRWPAWIADYDRIGSIARELGVLGEVRALVADIAGGGDARN